MSEIPAGQRLLAELKRRKVFRVAALYGAGAFAVLQGVDIMAEGLSLPSAVLTFVTVAVLIGFPVALVAAWVYERRPEGGLRRTAEADRTEIGDIVAQSRSRRWLSGSLGLAGTALLVFGVWLVASRVPPGDGQAGDRGAPTREIRTGAAGTAILVMPFAVQGSADVEYLEQGMVSLLGTSLDGAGDLRAVDARTVIQYAERESMPAGDRTAGETAAGTFGARLYVVGDIVEAGGRMQVSASLYEAAGDGQPIGHGSVAGTEDQMFDMVDDLTAQLLSGLSGGAAARVRRIAAVTTESFPALKAFLEGEEEFRRGQFGLSVESFRRAVAEDTTFALAYYRLSLVAEWNLEDRLSREMAEKAVRYMDRLADRDRRLLDAFLIRRRGDNLRAAEAYRSILGAHPDEMEAWLDLAEVQFHSYPLYGRSFTDATESLERVLDLDPHHSTALIHLARLRAYEGDIQGLEDLAARFIDLNPDPARNFEVEALRAYGSRVEERIAEVEDALPDANELAVSLAVWAASVYCRDPASGERVTYSLVSPNRSPEARRLGRAWLAYFAAAKGQWEEAKARLEILKGMSAETALEYEAIMATAPFSPTTESEFRDLAARMEALDPATVPTSENPSIVFTSHDPVHPALRAYQLGLIRARLGEYDAALALADEMEAMSLPQTTGSLTSDLAHGIRASVLRRQGDLEGALDELEKARVDAWYGQTMASPLFARIFERFLRAELLFELERYDEAKGWYANIGQLSPFELPYVAPARLRLAEIAQRSGDVESAARHRRAFDDLWAEADPGMLSAVGL